MKKVSEIKERLLQLEGGKKEVNAAQMGEVLAKLSDLLHEERQESPLFSEIVETLVRNGKRRARLEARKKKSKS